MQGGRCALTGGLLLPGVNASVDHIVPRSAGGTSDETNLQWVVADVNGWKGAMPMTRVVEMARKIVQVSCGN